MATTDQAPEKKARREERAPRESRPQDYYERIKQKFAEERDLRLRYRPEGTAQYTSDLVGDLAKYTIDPYAHEAPSRARPRLASPTGPKRASSATNTVPPNLSIFLIEACQRAVCAFSDMALKSA